MNRIIVLTFLLFFHGFLLSSCGPMPEKDAPELKKSSVGLVSPFDTLEIPFKGKVVEVKEENYKSNLPIKIIEQKEQFFIVSDKRIAGITQLLADTNYSITFKDLESKDGELQKDELKLSFRTMPILDSDFDIDDDDNPLNNNSRSQADVLADSAGYFDGTKLSDSVVVAGLLTANRMQDDDFYDWYSIILKVQDSVWVELSSPQNDLKISFEGPINDKKEIFDGSIEDDKLLSVSVDANRAFYGNSDVNVPQKYYLGVKYAKNSDQSPSPYVLKLKIITTDND
ncbi:MAG: hypothetical protein GX801_00265 [Fibrobacter sp.]|nr:hypothetical protein [Fibrobacter sp.]